MDDAQGVEEAMAMAKQLWVTWHGTTQEQHFRQLFERKLQAVDIQLEQGLFEGMQAQSE